MAFLSTATLLTDNIIALAEAAGASISAPGGLWSLLILNVFKFIVNYGARVVVFTVLLKLLLSPLDIFQRVKARKNQKITERLKPEMEKLKKQYPDPSAFSQKQMQLNRKEGYSYMSACLPAIATMVIFITLLVSLNKISRYMNFKEYYETYTVYSIVQTETRNTLIYSELSDAEKAAYDIADEAGKIAIRDAFMEGLDVTNPDDLATNNRIENGAVAAGQEAVVEYYATHRVRFIWVKNIWSPDVPWRTAVLSEKDWKTNVGDYAKKPSMAGIDEAQHRAAVGAYGTVTEGLRHSKYNEANGYLILPILALALSIGQQLLTRRQQKQTGQADAGGMGGMGSTMKIMTWIMPLMIGVFSLTYTAAFAVYLVVNYSVTMLITLTANFIFWMTDRKEKHKLETEVQKYGRPDPKDL